MAPTYNIRKDYYSVLWREMKIDRAEDTITSVAKRLLASKARYQAVSKKTGVPWEFIAVTHQRESNQNWSASLGQGDPWNEVSTHVPKGRGPFKSWEDSAIDAIVTLKKLDKIKEWPIERLLYHLEEYNGWGYYNRGIPSPYIWSHTNHYKGGKYIADHVFDPNVYDKQIGCAALLKKIYELDKTTMTPVIATVAIAVGAGGTAVATAPVSYAPYIIGGIFIAAAIGIIIYSIIKRK